MKRLNPKTGKIFKRGDILENGNIFLCYEGRKNKDGRFYEKQISKERYGQGKKRINPLTGKKFKRGDEREDGKIFLGYRKTLDKDGKHLERWVTRQQLTNSYERRNIKVKTSLEENKNKLNKGIIQKRKNPLTNEPFKLGEKNKDGLYFGGYDLRTVNGKNVGEWWIDEIVYLKKRVTHTLCGIKKKCKIKNIPFNLNSDFLIKIFPKDYICPVSKFKMKWGVVDSLKENSPSIDRIDPDKGYVKGNVRWVIDICNTLKSRRNLELFEKIYFDLLNLKKNKKINHKKTDEFFDQPRNFDKFLTVE